MKKLLPIVAVLVVATFTVIQLQNMQAIDIIGDLDDLRNTSTEAGVSLAQYHANTNVIDSLISLSDYDAASKFIDDLIESDSDYKNNYLFEKGRLLYDIGKYDEAKRVLTEVIVLSDSSHLKAYVWRGYSYALTGICDSAAIDLKFATSHNSSFQRDYDKVMKYCESKSN